MQDLHLRFRHDDPPDAPAVDAFNGPPPTDLPDPLVVLNPEAAGRPRFAIPREGHRIPLPGHPHAAKEAFDFPREVPVWLVDPAAPAMAARGVTPMTRAIVAVAAGLTLVAIPLPAHAAPEPAPAVEPAPAAEPAATEPAEDAEPQPEVAPTPEPDPAPQPQPEPATAPPPVIDSQAAIDAAWEGVVGYDVTMELRSGRRVDGRVSAVQRDTFTLIDFAAGGVVRVMSKAEVASVRVKVPPPLPVSRGTGLLVGGGILTGLGAPVLISGLVFLGIYPSGFYLHLPMLLTGGPAVGAGIAMLVRGSKKRRAYDAALQNRLGKLMPTLGRTRRGTWTGGLTLRF